MLKSIAIAAIASASMAIAPSARAQALNFDFHDMLGSDSFSFDLPSATPTPDFYQPASDTIFDVTGILNGSPTAFEVYFYNTVYSGGLSADDLAEGGNLYFQNGFGQYDPVTQTYQQLYSGQESAPVFSVGTFTLYAQDPETYESSEIPEGVLTVSAAPESSVWILLCAGIGLVGGSLRYRGHRLPAPARRP